MNLNHKLPEQTVHVSSAAGSGAEAHKDHMVLTVYCDPFIEVFSIWEHDSHAQVATAQCCFGMFQQLILVRALRNVLLWLESL